jgi:GTPase KRas protein
VRNLKSWLGSFRSVVGEMPVMILSNKADLERKISLKEIEEFGKEVGCTVLETSAKSGLNVELAFQEMGKKLLEAI